MRRGTVRHQDFVKRTDVVAVGSQSLSMREVLVRTRSDGLTRADAGSLTPELAESFLRLQAHFELVQPPDLAGDHVHEVCPDRNESIGVVHGNRQHAKHGEDDGQRLLEGDVVGTHGCSLRRRPMRRAETHFRLRSSRTMVCGGRCHLGIGRTPPLRHSLSGRGADSKSAALSPVLWVARFVPRHPPLTISCPFGLESEHWRPRFSPSWSN